MIESVEDGDRDERYRRKRRPQIGNVLDRLPPHNIEAEQGAIGSVLIDTHAGGGQNISLLVKAIGSKLEYFYDLRHQRIYAAFLSLYENREAIDLITVQAKLKARNELESVGGVAYLSSLMDVIPSAANLEYYLLIIKDRYLLRRMVTTCTDTVNTIYESDANPKELLNKCEAAIHSVGNEIYQRERRTIKEVLISMTEKIEQFVENRGKNILPGISTGFSNLDDRLLGLHEKEMIVVGARPSVGKTSLAMNIVEHIALVQKLPVAVYSFEMPAESLTLRMLASRARLSMRKIQQGYIDERQYQSIVVATGKIGAAPLYIEDRPGMELLEWKSSIRWLHAMYGIKVAVIDYLQLMKSASKRAQTSRQVEVSEISGGVKEMAMELGIPIIVLSQLNRDIEKEKKPRKPRLADLRESGSLEQDADVVLLPYRVADLEKTEEDDDLPPNNDDVEPYDVGIVTAKQRNGPTGIDFLRFTPQQTRFEVAAPEPKITNADVQSSMDWSRSKDL